MIPDMSDVLVEWNVPAKIKTVTETTIDLESVVNVSVDDIDVSTPQPPTPEQLNAASLDWSVGLVTFFSHDKIEINQYIEYEGKDYKIITDGNWQLYGFSEVIGEETKRALLVATP